MTGRSRRFIVVVPIISLALATTALASDVVFDKQGDAAAGALDIVSAGVDDSCQLGFSMAVSPANGVRPAVLPPASGRLPAFQLDRNGDGRADRLIGRPKGKPAGVYAISGTTIGKKLASARGTVDASNGGVKWVVKYSLAVKDKKIRWRAVNRSAVSGSLDRAPDKGFRSARWSRRGC